MKKPYLTVYNYSCLLLQLLINYILDNKLYYWWYTTLLISDGQFRVFQRFPSSNLVPKNRGKTFRDTQFMCYRQYGRCLPEKIPKKLVRLYIYLHIYIHAYKRTLNDINSVHACIHTYMYIYSYVCSSTLKVCSILRYTTLRACAHAYLFTYSNR